MFCSKDINDKRNDPVIAGITSMCDKFSMLPFPSAEHSPPLDILIINDSHQQTGQITLLMPPHSFILINSDQQDTYSTIRSYSGNLISYGLNQKACITASSIFDDEQYGQLQICIQRAFPTLKGGSVAVQEFPVHMYALGVEATIALVGTMLVCGSTIENINNLFNKNQSLV